MPAFDVDGYDSEAFDTDSEEGIHAAVSTSHSTLARDRLPQQFKRKPNIQSLIEILTSPMGELEQAIADVGAFDDLDTAFGETLQTLRKLVVQPELDMSDESLRLILKARVRANRSSGVGPDILRIARLVLDTYAKTVESSGVMRLRAWNDGVAAYRLVVENIDLPYSLAKLLMDNFLSETATADGVRAILEFTPQDGSSTNNHDSSFVFDEGEGLGFSSLPQLNLAPLTANVDTVVQHRDSRLATLRLLGDGSGVGSMTSSGDDWTFHFEPGVTTVANFESAVSSSAALVVAVVDGVGTMQVGDALAATSFTLEIEGGYLNAALE